MTGPLRSPARLLALACALLLAGCVGGAPAPTPPPPAPTPLASLGPALAGSVAAVTAALAPLGVRLDPPLTAYRPSEPAALAGTPRTVLQAGFGDPAQGYVVLYQLVDDPAADIAAAELARYLGSGFGQTNFPLDAQFHVGRDGSVVLLTWWSRERAADPGVAEAVFDALTTVGQPYPVIK